MEDNKDQSAPKTYSSIEAIEKARRDKVIHWYAVRVTAQWERKLIEMLTRLEPVTVRSHGHDAVKNPIPIIDELNKEKNFRFEAYVPIKQEIHQWSDRKKKVDVVQTPGVIFIRTSLQYKNEIYKVSPDHFGAYYTLPGKRVPEILSDEAMRGFMEETKNAESVQLIEASTFSQGDKVRMLNGSMKGRVFIVSSSSVNKKGIEMVTIELRLGERLVSLITIESARVIKVDKDAEDEIPEHYNRAVSKQ